MGEFKKKILFLHETIEHGILNKMMRLFIIFLLFGLSVGHPLATRYLFTGIPFLNNVFYRTNRNSDLHSNRYTQQELLSFAKYISVANDPIDLTYTVDNRLPVIVDGPIPPRIEYTRESKIKFPPDAEPFYLEGPAVYTNYGGGDLSGQQAGSLEISKDSTNEYLKAKFPPY